MFSCNAVGGEIVVKQGEIGENFYVIEQVVIITTRPKPTYGQQGLAGRILGTGYSLTSHLWRSARIYLEP